MERKLEKITSDSVPTQAVAEREASLLRREPAGGVAHWIAQSPRMVQQKATLQALFGSVAQRQTPVLTPNHTGMPDPLKAGVEALSGMSMDHVRVHYNSDRPAQLNALAYAQGSEIHLGQGQEKHLPHEAWHVVQQMQGKVRETSQLAGVGVNDEVGLEREADVMGQLAHDRGDSIGGANAASVQRVGGRVGSTALPAQSVAQCQHMKLELRTQAHEEAGRNRLPIQREVIRIGTDSGDGTLTYSPKGTIKLTDGTALTGMVLVLIQIPKAERNKKYGGQLMAYFMEKTVKDSACYLDVKVSDTDGLNAGQLVAWYQKYGFQVVGKSSTGPVMGINMPKVEKETEKKSAAGGEPIKLVDYPDSD